MEETDIDPIRHAATLGRPLIVLTDGGLTWRVREALSVARRMDDLREVRLSRTRKPHAYGTASRRMDPTLGAPTVAWCLSAPRPAIHKRQHAAETYEPHVREARKVIPEEGFLPPFDPSDACGPSSVTTVLADTGHASSLYAAWLLDAAVSRARSEGRPEPVLVFDGPHDRLNYGLSAFAGSFGFERMDLRGCGDLLGAVASVRWGCDPGNLADGTPAWAKALTDAAAAPRPAETDGWTFHSDGRRHVLSAQAGVLHKSLSVIYEIEDGACRAWSEAKWTGISPHKHARRVWHGGTGCLSRIGWTADRQATASAAERLAGMEAWIARDGAHARAFGRPVSVYPVPGTLSGSVDAGLQAAIGGADDFEAILAAVRSAPDPVTRRRRRDFAVTWPALADALLEDGARARIDAGERTVPLVASRLGTDPALARRLRGLMAVPHVAPVKRAVDDASVRFLEAIGRDRLPLAGDKAGWDALCRLSGWLMDFLGQSRIDAATAAGLLLSVPGKGWVERLAGFGDRRPGESRDMAHALCGWLNALAPGHVTRARAVRIVLDHGSILRIARASDRWHDDGLLSADTRGLPLDLTWPVPFQPYSLGVGIEARVLDGVQALVDEGSAGTDSQGVPGLHHCVGGYGLQCQAGASVVVSIRRTDGAGRLSTLELVPDPAGAWRLGDRPYALRQHRGLRNAEPPREASDAAYFLRESLKAGAVPIDAAALEPRQPPTGPRTSAHVACFHGAWRRILPEPWSRMGLQELARAAPDAAAEP